MMRSLFLAWALLAIAVHGRREESQSSDEGKQSQLDGTESAANARPRTALLALLLALSQTQAFTLGPGGSRAVGQRTSSNITTLFNHRPPNWVWRDEKDVNGKGDEAADLLDALANAATKWAAGAGSSPIFANAAEEAVWKEKVLRIADDGVALVDRAISLSAATELPFTGKTTNGFSYDNKVTGTYVGARSGAPLFSSHAKYDSGSGWPTFCAAIPFSVIERPDPGDRSNPLQAEMMGGIRTEIIDAKSGAHLGHVFNDGPKPTGKRYCMNAGAMTFVPMTFVPDETISSLG